jgi:hypothetical protein
MKKTIKDESAVGTFVIPDNVKAQVEAIEADARATYVDHVASQNEMVREQLIMALSRSVVQLENALSSLMESDEQARHWRSEYERVTA